MDKKNSQEQIELAIARQFQGIENLLQTENFDEINSHFINAYKGLEEISKTSGGLGRSKEARKAMKAIERIMDLLKELLKLKYKIVDSSEDSPPQGKK